jgi:hypothetical protein
MATLPLAGFRTGEGGHLLHLGAMADKTGFKTAKSPKGGAELPLGAHPGNTGGKKGRSGRKPAAWKEACEKALQDANALPVLQEIISGDIMEEVGRDRKGEPIYGDTKNSDRIGAVKFLAAYAYGQPKEDLNVGGKVEIEFVSREKRA